MSYNVFPSLLGRTWDIKKRILTSTLISQADSGAEYRTQRWQYPLYEFDLPIEYLAPSDYQNLQGFFIAQGGPATPFYLSVDNDSTATNQAFGTGDGSTTQFQLTNVYGSYWSEPIGGVNGTPTIYVNGVATTPSAISASGLVTFSSAPSAGAALTWSGNYFYLVRFKADQAEFNQFLSQMWESTEITFRTFR